MSTCVELREKQQSEMHGFARASVFRIRYRILMPRTVASAPLAARSVAARDARSSWRSWALSRLRCCAAATLASRLLGCHDGPSSKLRGPSASNASSACAQLSAS